MVEPKGVYTPPNEFGIHGIKSVVVDPHNEVLPYWADFTKSGPAIVIHIDDHSDIYSFAPTLESLSLENTQGDIAKYAKNHVGIDKFMCCAFNFGYINSVYWINPQFADFSTFGRYSKGMVISTPKTEVRGALIAWKGAKYEWDGPASERIEDRELFGDLSGYSGLLILDIDLDGFEGMLAYKSEKLHPKLKEILDQFSHYGGIELKALVRGFRIANLLERLPRPGLITIARSQTPTLCTPPNLVDSIENLVVSQLREIYSPAHEQSPDLQEDYKFAVRALGVYDQNHIAQKYLDRIKRCLDIQI